MGYAEDILKLRARFADALSVGAIDGSKETVEAMLIQIMNEAEKNRQGCATQAENIRKQISVLDGQAAAFSSVTSIVYNVLNGFVRVAERNRQEEDRTKAENAEREQLAAQMAAETEAATTENAESSDPESKNTKSKKKK